VYVKTIAVVVSEPGEPIITVLMDEVECELEVEGEGTVRYTRYDER